MIEHRMKAVITDTILKNQRIVTSYSCAEEV